MTLRDRDFRGMWDSRLAEYQRYRDRGQCLIMFQRKHRFQVVVPYTLSFLDVAKKLEGKFRKRTKLWTFPHYKHKEVLDVCNELFPGKVVVWGSPRIS